MIVEKLDQLDPSTSAYKILCHLTFRGSPMKPQDIAFDLSENNSTVRARLAELKKQGLVESKPEGYMALITPYDFVAKIYRDLGKK